MDRDNDSRSSFVFPLIFFVLIAAAGGMLLIKGLRYLVKRRC